MTILMVQLPMNTAAYSVPRRSSSSSRSSHKATTPMTHDNYIPTEELFFLQDEFGHVNSELATSIWNWERATTTSKVPYSTRTCLRWVDDIAKQQYQIHQQCGDVSYGDLLQEGMVALMYAMKTYGHPTTSTATTSDTFEVHAKRLITQALMKMMERRSIRLPRKVEQLLQQAKRMRASLTLELARDPSVNEVADRIGVSAQELAKYTKASQRTLSVESTMEVYNPLLDMTTQFEDSGENEMSTRMDDEEDAFLWNEEGEDLMWLHHEQITAPLKDMIPDDEDENEHAMEDSTSTFRQDVETFLTNCLSSQEVELIRLRFGLTGRKLSLAEIGTLFGGISPSRIKQMEDAAMEKLFSASSSSQATVGRYLEDDMDEVL